MTDNLVFAALCRSEAEVLAQLIDFLEGEQATLIAGEVDRLQALTADKVLLLERLGRQTEERVKWMKERHIHDMEAVAGWLADKYQATQAWAALEEGLKCVKDLNEFNGRVINKRLAHTQDALSILNSLSDIPLGYQGDGSRPLSFASGKRCFGAA